MYRFIPRPPAFVGVNLNSVVVFAWVEMDSSYHLRCTIESVRDYKPPAVRGAMDVAIHP